jgi:hypothetical protein
MASSSSGGGQIEDGSSLKPYTPLNIKHAQVDKFYLIKEGLESVVTRIQKIDGILVVQGVNTVL